LSDLYFRGLKQRRLAHRAIPTSEVTEEKSTAGAQRTKEVSDSSTSAVQSAVAGIIGDPDGTSPSSAAGLEQAGCSEAQNRPIEIDEVIEDDLELVPAEDYE
jgi:hypothetical protein